MIGIQYKRGNTFEYERRNIIEIINYNTVIIDSPFPELESLPEYIFDFKSIILEGDKNSNNPNPDSLSLEERY